MELSWPQKVIHLSCQPQRDIFRQDQVGTEGCQFQGAAPVPSPPLLLFLLLTLFHLALSAVSPGPSSVLCPLLWPTLYPTPTRSP